MSENVNQTLDEILYDIKEDLDKYKDNAGSDNIQYKEIINYKLTKNLKIIHLLNNTDLGISNATEHYGVNILPYYLLVDAQTESKNYICFETSFDEVNRANDIMKLGRIIFYIICDNKDIIVPDIEIARHDLLAALITDEFNWCNDFGTQIKLVSDRPSAIDSQYVGRTLIFEQITPNSIIKNGRVYNNTLR